MRNGGYDSAIQAPRDDVPLQYALLETSES